MNITTVHGFNVWDGGDSTIGRIEPYLSKNHKITQFDYGWLGLLGIKLFGKKIARKLAEQTKDVSVGIGHSNGCMELIRACEYGATFNHLIFINPALDNDIKLPAQVERVDVLYNPTDSTVTMAKYYPFSYWGDMGRVGYRGTDHRFNNHDMQQELNVVGHSGIFNRPAAVSVFIEKLLKDQ